MANATSIVSALGAGSGIDMAALAKSLADAQFQLRAERLTARSETLERQISSAATIKNTLSMLAAAMGDRVRHGDLSPRPTVSNPSVATASSPLGSAGKGSYTLEVLSLAATQTLTSAPFANGATPVGAGSLTIRFGTTEPGSFTPSAAAPLTIDIPEGAGLADVAAVINGKNAGISAYVAQTNNGAQLVLKGAEGAASGFILEASEAPSQEGLAALAWNPSAGGDPARLLSSAADGRFRLDGLEMTSASNTTGLVAPGLSLQLTGTNPGGATKVSFSQPGENLSGAMQDFVSALNEVAGQLRVASDPLGGDLSRDPGAKSLQRMLSQLGSMVIMPTAPDGAPRTLADLGLSTQRDGTFMLDTRRLEETLKRDPASVAAMFTPGLYGVYSTLDSIARSASRTGDPGSLGGSITRYQTQAKKVNDESADLADKQEALRASLAGRFAKADSRIGASQSTLTFLKAQIDAWNGSRE